MNYYFLAGYLPDIALDDRKVRVGFGDVLSERDHVSPGDWREIELILLGQDVMIVENLLSGRSGEVPFSVHGPEFWMEQIKSPQDGPPFLLEFLARQDVERFLPEDAARLWEGYYGYVLETSRNPFLKTYIQFELTLKNVIAAWRSRRRGLPPGEHVIGESDVAQALSRSNAEDFGLSGDYPWIERIISASDPQALQSAVESIYWEFLETEVEGEFPFDFSVILAYLLRLNILEKRLGLDREKGVEVVRQLEGS